MENKHEGHFTPEEIEQIKEQLLESIYADIGRSVIKKILWIGGAVLLSLFAYLKVKGV